MWIVRLLLLALLVAQVCAYGFFLARRKKYESLLENKPANLLLVIFYNLVCYLIAGLPSDPATFSPPAFLMNAAVRTGFLIIGLALMAGAALVMVIAVRRRKVVGGQDVKAGLLTSGVYRLARHPIYAGIVGMSLGLALALKNWDGLLLWPAILAVNLLEAGIEEKYDIGVRYPSEYVEYRQRTRALGPIWFWASVAAILVIIAVIPSP